MKDRSKFHHYCILKKKLLTQFKELIKNKVKLRKYFQSHPNYKIYFLKKENNNKQKNKSLLFISHQNILRKNTFQAHKKSKLIIISIIRQQQVL